MSQSSSPLLLALDTSTRVASVALFDGHAVVSETTWLAGREHSTRVLIEVQHAFARVGLELRHVTGLVVARGPGSFTGVRVAVSVAKGMAAGLSLPLWGVSSLEVVARAAGQVEIPVRAVLEAGRGRVATGAYLNGRPTDEPRLATAEELDQLIEAPTLVIGELPETTRALLEHHVWAHLETRAACLRRGGFLAELGWQRAMAGEPGDPQAVEALYVS